MSECLTYATVCSGIECMSVACRGLPLKPVFFSEIEPFPCAVLKAHYPTVPNLGDMNKIRVINKTEITNGTTNIILDRPLDIFAGGTPCQDVSVAGKRAGMAEGSNTRSSLAFEFVRLVRELSPRFVIWENVAGCIDSKNAPDFLRFVNAIGECGYSCAWRVLDAQYVRVDGMERAVPQRRRRVWLVGCLGADATLPAQILFEPDCVTWDTPPRRCTGQGFAYSLGGRNKLDARLVGGAPRAGSFDPFEPGGVTTSAITDNVAMTVVNGSCPGHHNGLVEAYENDHLNRCEVARSLNGNHDDRVTDTGTSVVHTTPFVKTAHARGKDGLGEKWEQSEVAGTRNAIEGGDGRNQECIVSANSNGEEVAPTLCPTNLVKRVTGQADKGGGMSLVRGFDMQAIGVYGDNNVASTCKQRDYADATDLVVHAKGNDAEPAVCYDGYNQRAHKEVCMTMRSAMTGNEGNDADPKVAYGINPVESGMMIGTTVPAKECGQTLRKSPGGENGVLMDATFQNGKVRMKVAKGQLPFKEGVKCKTDGSVGDMILQTLLMKMRFIVRRLTPVECERLMGLPDGYTVPAGLPAGNPALIAEFQRIFDTFGAIMAGYSGTKPPKPKTAAQIEKWLAKITNPTTCPDSPRYKACGNGWATNQPRWIIMRLLHFTGVEF